MEFHERLKEIRCEAKLTQKHLGKQLGYGSSAIANYESGRNEPSIQDLKKIAQVFGVSMDYLLGISNCRNPYLPITEEGLQGMSALLAQRFCDNEQEFRKMFQPILKYLLSENSFKSS